MDGKEKFSGKAQVYMKHRPGYPAEAVDDLETIAGLGPCSIIADIGAGTGILTRQLLERGFQVVAVEPNNDMRMAAENLLGGSARFSSIGGSAENTGLTTQSVDLVTAAQSFHWFDREQFLIECRRILKPRAFVALIWNSRDMNSALNTESADICARYCPLFRGFSGGLEQSEEVFAGFFRDGQYTLKEYRHDLEYDMEGFIGRNMSASYAPSEKAPTRMVFVTALTALFHKHEQEGTVVIPNVTRSYIGQV